MERETKDKWTGKTSSTGPAIGEGQLYDRREARVLDPEKQERDKENERKRSEVGSTRRADGGLCL